MMDGLVTAVCVLIGGAAALVAAVLLALRLDRWLNDRDTRNPVPPGLVDDVQRAMAEGLQRIQDALDDSCPPGCQCLVHTWIAVEDAYGEDHPDYGFEMELDDADAWCDIQAHYDMKGPK